MSLSANLDVSMLMHHFSREFQEPLDKMELDTFNHLYLYVKKYYFRDSVQHIFQNSSLNAFFLTMLALDNPHQDELFRIYLIFNLKGSDILLTLVTEVEKKNPTLSAISPLIQSAEWHERELHDLFGIKWLDIKLQPLVLHRDWPHEELFPLRKDFPLNRQIPIAEVAHQFDQPSHLEEGMHQVAVGPIHAGIIEPGHLRFCVTGEHIHKFDAQLFYTHKGIEKMGEGKHYNDVLNLAEHVCGLCAFAHSTAFCQAMEIMGHIQIPSRATYIRTICLELERLNSHMADLSAICSAGGYGFGAMHAARLRETLMQLTQHLTGHRFFRRFNAVGGLRFDVEDVAFSSLLKQLELFETEFKAWRDHVLECDSLLDRLESSGYLSNQKAVNLGLVGPSARGSGVERDVRKDHPYAAYSSFQPKISVHNSGDVLARTLVRIEEVSESIKLINGMINNLPNGPVLSDPPKEFPLYQPALSIVESAKGELLHWIKLDRDNLVYRWHVRSASYMNWRGMVEATMGNNIVPDAPLVNKSFNLCYACVDR